MKEKPPKTHFIVLVVGSVIFLMYFFASFESRGSGDLMLLNIWVIKDLLLSIAFYIVFASLVIGHGISSLIQESITEDAESNMEV